MLLPLCSYTAVITIIRIIIIIMIIITNTEVKKLLYCLSGGTTGALKSNKNQQIKKTYLRYSYSNHNWTENFIHLSLLDQRRQEISFEPEVPF